MRHLESIKDELFPTQIMGSPSKNNSPNRALTDYYFEKFEYMHHNEDLKLAIADLTVSPDSETVGGEFQVVGKPLLTTEFDRQETDLVRKVINMFITLLDGNPLPIDIRVLAIGGIEDNLGNHRGYHLHLRKNFTISSLGNTRREATRLHQRRNPAALAADSPQESRSVLDISDVRLYRY